MYAARVRPDYRAYGRTRTPRAPRPVSAPQLDLITKLLDRKEVPVEIAAALRDVLADPTGTTMTQAGGYIDALMALPRKVDPDAPPTATEIGYYLHDDQLWKVQENRQGTSKYAKRLVDGAWEYIPGGMYQLLASEAISNAEAKTIRAGVTA